MTAPVKPRHSRSARPTRTAGGIGSRPLAILTAVTAGLLTGAMVLIEVVLVPFWRAAPPAEFGRGAAGQPGRTSAARRRRRRRA